MLETISLQNFKAFKNLNSMPIKPITVLCGSNSCGKSSILQSILLLKQTIENFNPDQNLLLNGRFVRFGSFETLIYEHNPEKSVSFEFAFRVPPYRSEDEKVRPGKSRPFSSFYFRQLLSPESLSSKVSEHRIFYTISIKKAYKQESFEIDSLKPIMIDELTFSLETINSEGKIIPDVSLHLKSLYRDEYKATWRNLRRSVAEGDRVEGEAVYRIYFTNLVPKLIRNAELKRVPFGLNNIFNSLSVIMQGLLSSLTYIGPLREQPSRRYIYEEDIVEIGTKGENAAYLFLSERNRLISDHYFYKEKTDFFERDRQVTLGKAVRGWLDLMNIRGFDTDSNTELIYLNLYSNSSEKTKVNIADVGFGVSQIFPIILEGLRMPRGSTLLLEQPEIHLHPNLQMQMADYLISLALSDKNAIVETHSDHIINRLVRRIVEDEKFNLKDLVAIYFIKPTLDGAVYETVTIDEAKGIVNWPVDFFDQTANEMEKIIQAGIKKRRNTRLNQEIKR